MYEYYIARQKDGFYVTFRHVNHLTTEFLEVEASSNELSYKRKGEKCKTTRVFH